MGNLRGLQDALNNDDVVELDAGNGGRLLLNVSDEPVLLREPTKEECERYLSEFRRLQIRQLVEALCAPNAAGTHVFGLSGVVKTPKGPPRESSPSHWCPRVMALENIPAAAWGLLSGSTTRYEARNMLISRAPLAEQRAFVKAVVSSDVKSLAQRVKKKDNDRFVLPRLEEHLSEAADGSEFVVRILDEVRHQTEFTTSRKGGKRVSVIENKSSIPFLFALHLVGKGVILLPAGLSYVPSIPDDFAFPLALRIVVDRLGSPFEELVVEATNTKSRVSEAQRIERVLHVLAGVSTLSGITDVLPATFARIRNLLEDKKPLYVPNAHLVVTRIYDRVRPKEVGPMPKRRKDSEGETKRCRDCYEPVPRAYHWIFREAPVEKALSSGVPAEYHKNHEATFGVLSHVAHLLDKASTGEQRLRITPVESMIQKYLAWLAWRGVNNDLPRMPTSFMPDRLGVNDFNDDLQTSKCLRAWLYRTHGPDAANRTLSLLESAFALLIARLAAKARAEGRTALVAANPIEMEFDSFAKARPMHVKSVREAVPRDVLEVLYEVNHENDYALSRANPEHWRNVPNQETGQVERTWFPGVALLLEFLLLLPIRSFQTRFLDSGEMDEYLPAFANGEFVRTLNPNGKRGRAEGVLRLTRIFEEKPSIELHINTNKTAEIRGGSYVIPWAPEEVRKLLERMRAWQMAHNPVTKLVPCMEKVEWRKANERGRKTETTIRTSVPLFRDPDDADGWPLTKNALVQHWTKVNAEAQKRLRAGSRKNIVLVEERKNASRSVLRTTFDIHSLRVSGVTGLLEANLSPELIQLITGHTTLAMLLYYAKPTADKMEQKLSDAWKVYMEKTEDPSISESDYEKLSASLFNTQDSEFPKSRLAHERRRSTGAILTFTHGICPGGSCDSGGEDGASLRRAQACSLCRYRLTGPAFLPGLVMNANLLIHEIRSIGLEIAALNGRIRELDDSGKSSGPLRAKVETLHRQSEDVVKEWSAEFQYAKAAQQWLEKSANDGNLPLIYGSEPPKCELAQVSHFELLQNIVESGQTLMPGVCPPSVVLEHREYMTELIDASDMEPLLLRLRDDQRDRAAVLLGKALTSLVPTENHEAIRRREASLRDFPSFESFFDAVSKKAKTGLLEALDPAKLIQGEENAER